MLQKYACIFLATLSSVAAVMADEPSVSSLEITPGDFVLTGSRASQQLCVTANASSVTMFDATEMADLQITDQNVAVVRDGVVYPVGDGQAAVVARLGKTTATATVTVKNHAAVIPVAFHTEVLAALTKAGCNMGACHGSPSGKGGFRLSLRGYDPDLDLLTLRGEFFNRRSNLLRPDESLLLRKPAMQVAHGGGRRLIAGSPVYDVLRTWIAEGMGTEPPGTAGLERIDVLPKRRVLRNNARQQQLVVQGYFSDGSVRDVTPLVAFDSSDESIATVDSGAVVRKEGRGEATILARYLNHMSTTADHFSDRQKRVSNGSHLQ